MVYYGSRGYATAVEMDREKPIMPDIRIEETMESYLNGRDLYMEKALELFAGSMEPGGDGLWQVHDSRFQMPDFRFFLPHPSSRLAQ